MRSFLPGLRPSEPDIVDDYWQIEGGVPHCYVVGLDVGKLRDHSAICVNEVYACENVHYQRSRFQPLAAAVGRKRIFRHSIVGLNRYELGTPYPELYASVKRVMEQLPSRDGAGNQLVVDSTGVGGPCVDGLRHIGLRPIGVTITGGMTVTQVDQQTYHVPKFTLGSTLDAVLSQDRLDISNAALAAHHFKHELSTFSVKVRAGGIEALEAERERDHDDLVMAAALAVWHGENIPTPARFLYIPKRRI